MTDAPPPLATLVNQARVIHAHNEFYLEFSQNGLMLCRLALTPGFLDELLGAMTTERAKWAAHVVECNRRALDS